MKTGKNLERDAQLNAISYALNVLRMKGAVKSQKDFASLLGVSEQTITNALRGKGRSLNMTLVERIAEYMQREHQVDIYNGNIYATGDAIAAPSAPADSSIKMNDENTSRLLDMLDERDAQINRLLTLLENEQEARKSK